ncbi:MAG TPA: dihydrofolate reductase family protein, partial [Candidatus Paceibacterota bacterium]|nr:dihydrofolate reductase family protein [Candidatus Paceibacterota bacterium]
KIATASGESKWITGELARAYGMKLRQGSDAILVGVNTILADDPSLTFRKWKAESGKRKVKTLRRIVLDSMARTPLTAKVVTDDPAASTTIVVSSAAPKQRVAALARRVRVLVPPAANSKFKIQNPKIPLPWLLKELGRENVTSLLVEGGGEVNGSFLLGGNAHRVAFFYAPKILGGRHSKKGVAGDGVKSLAEIIELEDVRWKQLGPDLLLRARVRHG